MKKLKILVLFLIACSFCSAQIASPYDFIPEGYFLFDEHHGDLNRDGESDHILIIKKKDTSMLVVNRFGQKVDRNRLGILIVFSENKKYELVVRNLECFSSENEDGGVYFAPELDIYADEHGDLNIVYSHGRYGYWGYVFRYQSSSFELIKYYSVGHRGPIKLREINVDYLLKKELISKNLTPEDYEGDGVFEHSSRAIEFDSLIRLSDIEDIEDFGLGYSIIEK